jgi:ATP-dependent DNA helicase RecQ
MDRSRLEMMRQYAECTGCRRAFLLAYFAQPYDPPCGACDNCREGIVALQAPGGPFPGGCAVRHPRFGAGAVVRRDDDRVTVLFGEGGYRTLSVRLALERGLLRPDG